MAMELELTEEQELMRKMAREFALKEFTPERGREFEEKGEFPWELYRKCGEHGYLGMSWPEEYGGQGVDLMTNLLVGYEFVRAEPTLAAAVFGGIFGADIIAWYGTEEQKSKWLPRLAKGEITSAGCFTEPAGGSDLVRVLDTRAVRDEKGDWIINGTKTFITNGTTASVFVTLVQTDPQADRPYRGQTEFVLPRSEGIEATAFERKIGWHASPTCEVKFTDVRATDDDIVGGPDALNRGFYMGMSLIDKGRLGLGLQSLAVAEAALDKAIEYAKEREAFGKPIGSFQGLAFRIVEMVTRAELLRSLLFRAAKVAVKASEDMSLLEESIKLASMVKWYGCRLALEACDLAIDVLGGYGIVESDVERWFRFAKVLEILEGTKEVQKSTIARMVLGKDIVKRF